MKKVIVIAALAGALMGSAKGHDGQHGSTYVGVPCDLDCADFHRTIPEDDPAWDCLAQGNRVCGQDATLPTGGYACPDPRMACHGVPQTYEVE